MTTQPCFELTPFNQAKRLIRRAARRAIAHICLAPSENAVIVVFRTRVICIYANGTLIQSVRPAPSDIGLRVDPHYNAPVTHRLHARALNTASDSRRRGWKNAARADLALARSVRVRG